MFRIGDKVVYTKKSYTGIKANKIYTIKTIKENSITIEGYNESWNFSKDCFISLSEYRRNKLIQLKEVL